MHHRPSIRSSLAALAALATLAAPPSAADVPGVVNYQGVLRDASDVPLDGPFDMVFRLFSAETGGHEILVDRHRATTGQAVAVSGGLFNADIGGGEVVDGGGPGYYVRLSEVFRSYDEVWLGIQIGSELLSPRVRILAAAYAMNADALEGRPASDFLSTDAASQTKLGRVTFDNAAGSGFGVTAFGPGGGGWFKDSDQSGYAYLGYLDWGVQGYGNSGGGYFANIGQNSTARLAQNAEGVWAEGPTAGGYFRDSNSSAYARVGYDLYSIQGFGARGAYFGSVGTTLPSQATIAVDGKGVEASGVFMGGSFFEDDTDAFGLIGYEDHGVWGVGAIAGGHFADDDSVGWANVGSGSYKINGSGTVSFVQNHPDRADRVIVYAAPEGDEVAVYTRGSARLADGRADVRLGETFAWVANPEVGLTAHLTPRDAGCVPYVVSVSTERLEVAGDGARCDALAFDYIVHGLRIGFEDLPIVQEKRRDAFLPLDETIEELRAGGDDVVRSSAGARFEEIERSLGRTPPESDAARELAARINVGRETWLAARAAERALLRSPRDARAPEANAAGELARPSEIAAVAAAAESADPAKPAGTAAHVALRRAVADDVTAVVADRAVRAPVSEPVEAGDVLALDPFESPALRRADAVGDPQVLGIAAGPSRPARGGGLEAPLVETRYADVRADAGYGEIRAGDLLVSSPTPGHAMRALDAATGTVVGKALEPLETGTGRIRVLVLVR